MAHMGPLQIDSVNVFSRSHYMPLFSRLGAYETGRLDKLAFSPKAPYVEYWAHAATLIPIEDWSLYRFRMDSYNRLYGAAAGEWVSQNTETIEAVKRELAERGPLRPAEIEDESRAARKGPWWDWDAVKRALEFLFMFGEVAIAGRRGFERRYALAEHVIPSHVLDQDIAKEDAIRELMGRALASCGVATLPDLADYYRVHNKDAAIAVQQLEDAGIAVPVRVEGFESGGKPMKAWRHRDAVLKRKIDATAILTPFDPLVWFRDRAARLYDFDYRIEIYTPAAKRRYGYYSLPLLAGETIVGRMDLKADRSQSTLLVQSAWWEHEAHTEHADAIAQEIRSAAAWQGLENISVSGWGNATDTIAGALGSPARHERAT